VGELYLTRRTEISFAHRHAHPAWDEATNARVFGKSHRLHGHNLLLEVTVAGRVEERTGMVFNMSRLKGLLGEVALSLDHRNLNEDVPELRDRIPTPENVVRWVWTRLAPRVAPGRLARVRVQDGGEAAAYEGEGGPPPPPAPGPVYVTRAYTFSSAHRLHSPALSDEENRKVYDKCNRPHGHGHTYRLEVTVAGSVRGDTGQVLPPGELDAAVQQAVVSRFDHADLNADPLFRERVPTAENLLRVIWELLKDALPAGTLHRLRLEETRDSFFEYYG